MAISVTRFLCTLAVFASLLQGSSSQPPYMPGWLLQGADLEGQPIPVDDPSDSDGQYCAFRCNADAACMGFNWAGPGCKGAPACPFKAGCCWLKASGTSAGMNSSAPACAGSMTMRPDPAALERLTMHKGLHFRAAPPPGAKNVLYLLADDLRPDVAPFGPSWMQTPGLQALASAGATFTRTYCNIAVCSPSRNSFLTGKYPSRTKTWNFVNHFRQATCTEMRDVSWKGKQKSAHPVFFGGAGQCCSTCTADTACAAWSLSPDGKICHLFGKEAASETTDNPGAISGRRGSTDSQDTWVSLPEYFRVNGYFTQGAGKIFHTEEGGSGPAPWDGEGTGMPPLQDPPSWSAGNTSMAAVNALAPMRPCGSSCSVQGATKEGTVQPGVNTFEDRTIAEDALVKLSTAAANLRATGQPFFLAVGFRKPHLPFRHPAPWDADYPDPGSIPLAKFQTLDPSVPLVAFHETNIATSPFEAISNTSAGTLRRDYYAAISWMDSQLQRVTSALEELGLRNSTLVVFHSDHGWSLGEYGEWEKFTNWEHGTRVPLVISAPWIAASAGSKVDEIVELVDVYPTLAALAGLPPPPDVDGRDLSPLLDGTTPLARSGETNSSAFALSVFPRCPAHIHNASLFWQSNDCMMVERSAFPFMGISIRTDIFRYTEWRYWNGTALAPSRSRPPIGVELYDHTGDDNTSFDSPYEVKNLAGQPSYAAAQAQLAQMLQSVYPQWAD